MANSDIARSFSDGDYWQQGDGDYSMSSATHTNSLLHPSGDDLAWEVQRHTSLGNLILLASQMSKLPDLDAPGPSAIEMLRAHHEHGETTTSPEASDAAVMAVFAEVKKKDATSPVVPRLISGISGSTAGSGEATTHHPPRFIDPSRYPTTAAFPLATSHADRHVTGDLIAKAPRLVCCGFHAYQKGTDKMNTKSNSFCDRKLFVTNQNKTGLLYFVIDKDEGKLDCIVEMLAVKEGETAGLTPQRKQERLYEGTDLLETAGLFRITETTLESVPDHCNLLGRRADVKFTPIHICASRPVRYLEGHPHPVLASAPGTFPYPAGRYLVETYPIMGLSSKRIDDRPAQLIAIIFPEKEECYFMSSEYKMVSKDPEVEGQPGTGQKRKAALPLFSRPM